MKFKFILVAQLKHFVKLQPNLNVFYEEFIWHNVWQSWPTICAECLFFANFLFVKGQKW